MMMNDEIIINTQLLAPVLVRRPSRVIKEVIIIIIIN